MQRPKHDSIDPATPSDRRTGGPPSVRRLAAAAAGLLVAIVTMSTGVAKPSAAPENPGAKSHQVVVDYIGQIQDQQGSPISGVFPLNFKLYDAKNSAHAIWQKRDYVAVVDGNYTVALGADRTLDRSALGSDAWIGVELVGEGELLRDRFRLDSQSSPSSTNTTKTLELSDQTQQLLQKARAGKQIAYADVAGRAVSADKAEVAERAQAVGDMSADDIRQQAQLALDRLGEHIANPDAHQATGGIRLGSGHKVTEPTGGDGGDEYRRDCPPGYVVTGIRGASGKWVDSISVVCQKLR